MAAAGTWRQQHNSSASQLDPTVHHPRSLASMLADSRRALPPASISETINDVPEGELEGESEFIALSDDVAPLFHARLSSSPARRLDSRDTSSRELLADLFPTGFTSNTLSPLHTKAAAAATDADEFKPASGRTLGDAEQELKGQQVWACLMPKAVPATVASSNCAPDVDRVTELHTTAENARNHLGQSPLHPSWGPSHQPHSYSGLHRPNCDELDNTPLSKTRERDGSAELTGLGSSNAKATTATRRADLGAPPGAAADPLAARRKTSFVSDGGGYGVVVKTETAEVAWRERERDLKHALDRLVSRLMQSQEREKFLEGNLEQAKHVESGRNALVKQITTLEEEVKHAHHRLEIHHAEAAEWREKRQVLEADNERLGAELHCVLGRNTRLETENRRKDALLVEVRKSADARAENNSTFEAELRRKDQLLVEAERDKKQAWQATSASAGTAKAAITRAGVAVKEASDLRLLRGDAGGSPIKRSDKNGGFASEERQSDQKYSQSLTDVIMAAAIADGGYGGLEKTRRSSGPAEASSLQGFPLAEQYGERYCTIYHSPETESPADRAAVPPPNEAVSRGQKKLGRSSTSDFGVGFSTKSNGAPRVPPPQAAVVTTDCRTPRTTPHTVFFDDGGSDRKAWRKEDKGVLSPPRETQEPTTNKNFLTPGSGRRMHVVETPPPAARTTGREQCYDGDRQRHDSEGVKGALTGSNPAWTDAPPSFGGGSSTAPAGSHSSGGGGGVAAGSEEFARYINTFGREAGGGDRRGEEAHCRNEESRDHADKFSTWVGRRTIDEVGLGAEGGGTPAADEAPPVSRGWKLQQDSPSCPAAGHRRGRDMMSSRRSSLSGAGVGVSAEVAGEASETSPIGAGGKSEQRRATLSVGDAADAHHGVGDNHLGGQQLTGEVAQGYGRPPSAAARVVSAADYRTLADHRTLSASGGMTVPEPEQRRKSTGGVRPATLSSVKSTQHSESLASLLGNGNPRCDSGTEEISRREKRASAPFATDAAEDELRPVREVERRLTLLQMETSQLEAEQSKLMPKASKTMQARVQLQKIDSRLALLASESSGLRRILREKPWRM